MKSLSRRGIMRLFGASAAGAAVATRLPPESVRSASAPMAQVGVGRGAARANDWDWHDKAHDAFMADPEKQQVDRAVEEIYRACRKSDYAREVMLPEIDCMRSWSPTYRALRQSEIMMERRDRKSHLERERESLWGRFKSEFERSFAGVFNGKSP